MGRIAANRVWGLGLWLWAVTALADFYQTPLEDVQWQVGADELSCRLSQTIPHLGQVYFRQVAGEPLRLLLLLENEPRVTEAGIQVRPPPWRHGGAPGRRLPVDGIEAQGGLGQQLWVQGPRAERLLAALFDGLSPEFFYLRSWGEELSEARVLVPAVRFWDAYDRFQDCRRRLPPYGLKDFQNLLFYFPAFETRLPDGLVTSLARIAIYLKHLGRGQVAVTDATADVAGRESASWFRRRLEAVRRFLQQQGLKPSQVIGAGRPETGIEPRIQLRLFGPEAVRLYHYDRRQTELTRSQKRRLALLARYVLEYFSGRVVIHGHSDGARWRSGQVSQDLARRWAERVHDFLRTRGVPAERMAIRTWGAAKPLASNRSRAGQARNRRVEIELVAMPVLTAAR